jgi:hypothetical protein
MLRSADGPRTDVLGSPKVSHFVELHAPETLGESIPAAICAKLRAVEPSQRFVRQQPSLPTHRVHAMSARNAR